MRALLLVFVVACAGEPRPPGRSHSPSSSVLASLERGVCFGWCPIYRISISTTGLVEYVGEDNVMTTARQYRQLSAAELDELHTAFAQARYSELRNAYTEVDRTDQPTVITSYRGKIVEHYHGDRAAPEALTTLESEIDRIVGTHVWIGTAEERDQRFSPMP